MALAFHPGEVKAGFFSSIIKSNEANADTLGGLALSSNSQTMSLLQANVLPDVPLSPQKGKEKQEDLIDENKDINIVSNNALLPSTGPVGVSDGSDEWDSSLEPSVYVVRKGDTISQIAAMFDVSPDTVLTVNDMKPGQKPVEGEVLLIL
ncbi:MAG: LysM domain-containing protein, partial [Candidatus Paceibacterota bacterium]